MEATAVKETVSVTAEADRIEKRNEEAEHDEGPKIEFKMVTFSLAGKDYSIDIMKVKEIAKAGSFTYVPNSAPFVLGVYNLRGDIIPIIDLRVFFNIPIPERKSNLENMLIITCEEQTFGIVVDYIDKVITVDSSRVRPPHPLFGDINIKYISAVVESNGILYILLDIERIFGRAGEAEEADKESRLSLVRNNEARAPHAGAQAKHEGRTADVNYQFVTDSLLAFKKFIVNDITSAWMQRRFDAWKSERGKELQLRDEADADAFLAPFFSQCDGEPWSQSYADAVYAALPDNAARQISVWNPGCGRGYEAYSLACLCKKRYPGARVKVFAQDIDLINVSNASLLSMPEQAAKDWYGPYLVKTATGAYTFSPEIKDMIFFEYHDVLNTTAISQVDVIFCRDVLAFLPVQAQKTLLIDFAEKLKGNGIVITGDNESLAGVDPWREHTAGKIAVYTK